MVAWLRDAGPERSQLVGVLDRFLAAEFWYHQTLADFGGREKVSHDDLRNVADRRRITLTALVERLAAAKHLAARANVVRHLLLAECHYHLRETRSVIRDLEAALAEGGGHPLVYFALGYNRFDEAREVFTDAELSSQADPGRAEQEFRTACLGAVEAFRSGLTGETFDAQLHFWIGRTLAAAGLFDEAEAALETAGRIDPNLFGQPPAEEAPGPPARGPGPIDEDEVGLFTDRIREPLRLEDLLADD
jgi:tetratricopeptide (TPR) repeat protein